jgi:hypothetical protein
MKTLEEFLHERAEIERGRADEKTAVQQEWIGAVRRLLDQMTAWLREADQDHLLEIEETSHTLREFHAGVYTAPGLVIRLDARQVQAIPTASRAVGPYLENGEIRVRTGFGQVNLTDGGRKFRLYRSHREPADEWVVMENDRREVKRLDRQAFEEVMQSLLQ